MSNDKLNKIKNNFCETDNINKSHEKLDKDKEELINPLSLLSSDLLKEINNIDEKNTVGKKESSIDNNLQSDSDTQKESDENEEEEIISENDKNSEKELLNFEIFKKDEKEKSEVNKKYQKRMIKQQSSMCLNNINLQLNPIDNVKLNQINNMRNFNNNCFQNQNQCEFYNKQSNNFTNQFNFFNNSFTMNGKRGWVCTHCKNFNYESKYLNLIFL